MQTHTPPPASASDLFLPVQFGACHLRNRIVMAPLTRSRAEADGVPGKYAADYYRQRATAGLIIAEAAQISAQGKGYAGTPGIYNSAHVKAWATVTRAVHAAGGRIFLQLWHVGRISHPSLQPHGELPVAPSAIQPAGQAFTENGFQPFVTPRELTLDEIAGVVEQYRSAAERALDAGFDGVEIHAANGYLLDQFLRDSTNHRTDAYGGALENRSRLLMEVTAAVTGVWGSNRVGVRLSPLSPMNDISDSNPQALFTHVVQQLNLFKLLYLHVIEGVTGGPRDVEHGFDLQSLRRLFNGLYIANNGYDLALAEQRRAAGQLDLVAFGRPFIANPDLVHRLQSHAALATFDQATLYGGGEHGYTDYPAMPTNIDAEVPA
ncbi:alkene reductase [Massilia sp. S19_KUP03_FR1]|uniref:alkene reductase n=1 Tax=Massilia sp. S19_KUP03_FR1 TaxID=3025503 RepID=UPI002FCD8A4F